MDEPTPRPVPAYPGRISDKNIRGIFRGAEDLMVRTLVCGKNRVTAYFIDGLTAGGDISEYILKPLYENQAETMREAYDKALDGSVYNASAGPCQDLDSVAMKLVNGFCVVLFPGVGAAAFEVKSPQKRMPSPPEVENTVKGPKDAFVETMRINTCLIRRHLRSPDLRLECTQVGRRSLTNVTVVWLEGITSRELVRKLRERLDAIDIDGLLSPAAVEEYVTGGPATAFPVLQYTERTDRFCQGLLDGRVGLLVDGLPLAYLAPADLGCFMESAEDRGRDFITASCVRGLRYLALFVDLLLPGVYIALASFHQALIPMPMLRAMIEAKRAVPFPTATEVLGLLIAFELLQESGVHLPRAVGQSVSVIGGIVMGTAAVEAGFISPVALIAVSTAGICGFVLPNRDFAEGVRVWRFWIASLSAWKGFYGTIGGTVMLLIHLHGLQEFGVPYLNIGKTQGVIRPRLKKVKTREKMLHPEDRRNQK